MKNKNTTSLSEGIESLFSAEAEQSVLGGLMMDPEKWDDISDIVTEPMFYARPHKLVFAAIKRMVERSMPLDIVTLSEEMERHETLADVGGFAFLVDLNKNTPSAANIKAYAQIVQEKATMRQLRVVGQDIITSTHSPEGRTPSDLVDNAEAAIYSLAEHKTSTNSEPQNPMLVLERVIDQIEQRYQGDGSDLIGVDTGFEQLNQKTGGLCPTDLIIVAARPAMGKTTFAMNLVEKAMETSKYPALVFSLEMPNEQLMTRLMASMSGVDQTRLRQGVGLTDEDWAKISTAMGTISECEHKLRLDDSSGLTPTELRSKARKVAREHGGLSLIMVDYLQLMRVPHLSDNRTLEISEISRSLKALAKELNVPVVALSQLNRSLEARADKRPINSDLRESGAIEQDADVIMFLYRDEVYNENPENKGKAEVIIGKQRNGPIGTVDLTFHGSISRFKGLEQSFVGGVSYS